MAEQHVRAVQLHSQIDDRETRHVLEVIALDIGRDGSPAKTSNRKIAQRARMAVNTVRAKIDELVASGELIAQRSGKYSFYALNDARIPCVSISDVNHAKTRENQLLTIKDAENIVSTLQTNIDTISDTIVDTIENTLYQKIVSIVSTLQTNADTEDIGKINNNIISRMREHFLACTGFIPPHESTDDYQDKWIQPFQAILDKSTGEDEAIKRIDYALGILRKRQYTITSPKSIYKTALNWQPERQSSLNGDWQILEGWHKGMLRGDELTERIRSFIRQHGERKIKDMSLEAIKELSYESG